MDFMLYLQGFKFQGVILALLVYKVYMSNFSSWVLRATTMFCKIADFSQQDAMC